MDSALKAKYEIWLEKAVADPDLKPELEAMAGDEAKIEDAFYKDLEFGTAGLRGVIGAGTNRMNVYIVARASQGLSNYVINHFHQEYSNTFGLHHSLLPCEEHSRCLFLPIQSLRM